MLPLEMWYHIMDFIEDTASDAAGFACASHAFHAVFCATRAHYALRPDELISMPPERVRVLDLSNNNTAELSVALLASMTRLETLVLASRAITVPAVFFAALSTHLRVLHIQYCDNVTDASIIQIAAHMPQLEELVVKGINMLTDDIYPHVGRLTALRRLTLCVSPRALLALDTGTGIPINSETYDTVRQAVNTNGRLAELLWDMPRLTSLDLGPYETVATTGVMILCARLRRLTFLHLSACQLMCNDDVRTLAARMPQLRHLVLQRVGRVTNFAPLARLTQLRSLTLFKCKLTDTTLLLFAKLKHLHLLNVRENAAITMAAIDQLYITMYQRDNITILY